MKILNPQDFSGGAILLLMCLGYVAGVSWVYFCRWYLNRGVKKMSTILSIVTFFCYGWSLGTLSVYFIGYFKGLRGD